MKYNAVKIERNEFGSRQKRNKKCDSPELQDTLLGADEPKIIVMCGNKKDLTLPRFM